MIIRWYMALQELDFTLEFLPGVKNTIADSLSRLCFNNMSNLPREFTRDDLILSAIMPHFTIPQDKYRIISGVHSSLAGHHGVERSSMKLTKAGHTWPFLRQHVNKLIKECPLCQKIS